MLSGKDIALRTAFSFVTVVGVTGNILVCLVVLLNKPMRTSMNYLLVNLAVSDMILLVFFSPTFIFKGAYSHPVGITGDIFCSLITGETLAWMGGYVSSAFLLAVSIERYFAVAHPHSYGTSFITKNLRIMVSGCWLFSLAWNSVGFVWKRYDEKGSCIILWSETQFKIYSMLSFFVVGFIPMVTMAILYSRVVYLLWFKNVVIRLDEERQRKKKKRATKMVLIVSLVYALCWFPELTVFVLFAYSPQSVKFEVAYPVTVAFCCLNSAINPIIYSFHNNQFRYYLKKLVCCCCSNEVDDGFSTGDKSDAPQGTVSQLQVQSCSS